MKRFEYSFACAIFCVVLAVASIVLAAPDANIGSTTTSPFSTLAVTTGSSKIIGTSDNDLVIAHTGLQNDGATASVATDYVIVMISGATMSDVTTAGVKLYIPAGGSATIRGFDLPFVAADGVRECIIQAYGHGAMIQVIKGSIYGSKQ